MLFSPINLDYVIRTSWFSGHREFDDANRSPCLEWTAAERNTIEFPEQLYSQNKTGCMTIWSKYGTVISLALTGAAIGTMLAASSHGVS